MLTPRGRPAADPDPRSPTRARPCSSSRRHCRSVSSPRRLRRSPPPTPCSNPPPAPACSPSSPRWPGPGSCSTSFGATRASLLGRLFPAATVTRFDARPDRRPSRSGLPSERGPDESALLGERSGRGPGRGCRVASPDLPPRRLPVGGRLVAITGASLAPEAPAWRPAFRQFAADGAGGVLGSLRSTVASMPATAPRSPLVSPSSITLPRPRRCRRLPVSPGEAPDAATLLAWCAAGPATPLPVMAADAEPPTLRPPRAPQRPARTAPASMPVPLRASPPAAPVGVPLAYATCDWSPPETGSPLGEALYEPYALQVLRIPGARPHPTPLV